MRRILRAALLALALAPSAFAAGPTPATAAMAAAEPLAPNLHLRLRYETRAIGRDGVQRDSVHTDRMVRGDNVVWIERELPAALRESEAHGHRHTPGPHAGHAHDEAQGAPLLVRNDAQGQVHVHSVLHGQRRVIDVDLAHQANVGYGGSWAGAYWLIDPLALQRMEKLGPVRHGVQRYRLRGHERTTLVEWDVVREYARSIEQSDGHGLSRQKMTATVLPLPAKAPWQQLQGYSRGDYSDLLD